MGLQLAFSAILLFNTVLGQTVTITRNIPPSDHRCIKDCLYRPYNRRIDIGDVLECAAPYEENCYCPTGDAQAALVSRHIDACATESCSRGDLTQDVDKMRAHYATYCVLKGYTASQVEEWYSALETAISTTSEGDRAITAVTTTTTTSTDEKETGDSPASTSRPTSTVATSTGDNSATTRATDDGRTIGLPAFDDGALVVRPGWLLLCLAPFVAAQLL